MALKGEIRTKIGTNNLYDLWIEWAVNSQNIAERISNITVTMKACRNDGNASAGAFNNAGNNSISLWVGEEADGTDITRFSTGTANIDLRTTTGTTLATWTGDVPHDSNGELHLLMKGAFYFAATGAASLPQGTYSVAEYVEIDPIRGLVRIHNGTEWETYQAYIHNGTEWELYEPYVHNGTNWGACT